MKNDKSIKTPSILHSKYRYLRLLGEGSNGKTFLAKNLFSGEYVAIKALKLNQSENFKSFEPWHIYVLTSSEYFEKLYGRRADKSKKLYNGMLPCTLYQFFKPYEPSFRSNEKKPFNKGKDFKGNPKNNKFKH